LGTNNKGSTGQSDGHQENKQDFHSIHEAASSIFRLGAVYELFAHFPSFLLKQALMALAFLSLPARSPENGKAAL
jgi:hypothetical protein